MASTVAPNPHVCYETGATILTNPNFDCTLLRLQIEHSRLILTEVGGRSHARTLHVLDPSHNGGLHAFGPSGPGNEAGGAHNRNLPNISAASWLSASKACSVSPCGPCRVANGVEDASTGLSAALASAYTGV